MIFSIYDNYINQPTSMTKINRDWMIHSPAVIVVLIYDPGSVKFVKQAIHSEVDSSQVKVFIVYNWHVLDSKVFPATSIHPEVDGPQTV